MHKDHLPEICEHCHGRLDLRAESTPELTLVPGLCEAWIPIFAGYAFETLVRQMGLGRIRSTMWFVGRPRVNFGRWPGKFLGCRIISVCVTPAKPQLRPKMKAAEHVVSHSGSRLIATAWDLPLMVLRLRLLGTPQMFVRCPSNLYRRLRCVQPNLPTEELNSRTSTQLRRELLPLPATECALAGWGLGSGGAGGCWCCKNLTPGTPQLESSPPPAPALHQAHPNQYPKCPPLRAPNYRLLQRAKDTISQALQSLPTAFVTLKTTNCLWTTHCVCISVRLIPAKALKPGKQNWVVSKSSLSRWLHPPLPNENRSGRPSRTWFVKQLRI